MKNDGLVSVIVPVYNVQQYIDRCVKSLLKQTYSNLEILLIDDGSTDIGPQICDKYAAEFDYVYVYHKKNGGLGSARNYGLQFAKGEYICFVDSDDEVSVDYVEKMYNAIEKSNADLCICGYYYATDKKSITNKAYNATLTSNEAISELSGGKAIFNFAWNKMYKKQVIDCMEMHYSDRHCAEDLYFNIYFYKVAEKVEVIESPLYTYFVNMKSLSNGRRDNFWSDMLLAYNALVETCSIRGIDSEIAENALFVFLRNTLSNYLNFKGTKFKDFNKFVNRCFEFKNISEYRVSMDKLQRPDKILYDLLRKDNIKLAFYYIKFSKTLKSKMFGVFALIRKLNG